MAEGLPECIVIRSIIFQALLQAKRHPFGLIFSLTHRWFTLVSMFNGMTVTSFLGFSIQSLYHSVAINKGEVKRIPDRRDQNIG